MTKPKEHWILNYGSMPGCLDNTTPVVVLFRNGNTSLVAVNAANWDWENIGNEYDIIAWRRA